jgi:hypothetical protein
MRLDFLCSILLIAAVACGGDDDGTDDEGTGDDDGMTIDAGEAGSDAGAGSDAAPALDGGVTGDDCGGFANRKCAETHFCDWRDDSCGVADKPGECQPRPADCEAEPPPVCGCDGLQYDNACEAEKAGTDVAQLSACSPR